MKDKIEKEIRGLRESDFEFQQENHQEVYIYLKKTYRDGEVKWRLRDIFTDPPEFGEDIECEEGYKQVIVQGLISERDSRYKYCNISDAEIVAESPVNKQKSQIKEYIVELWQMCFPDTEPHTLARNPQSNDFKITTTWGDTKAGHMGSLPVHADKNFKLGVNWQTWHRRKPEDKIRFLTHELTHIIHGHHRREFFIKHAEAVRNLSDSEDNKRKINSWFGSISWDDLKAGTLNGPHRQSSEIRIGNAQHRHEAVNQVVEEMEEVIGYNYQSAQRLRLNPPLHEIKLGYIKNTDEDAYVMVDISELSYNQNYSDTEINELINDRLVDQNDYGFDYGIEQLPVINEDLEVVENSWYVNMIDQMKRSEWNKTPECMRDELEIKIPCIYE